MTTLNNLSKLLESDLEQARLIFATNDVVDRLQSMAEQIAKMSVNDVMPIVDDMRGTFGPEKADTFEAAVNEALDAALEAIKSSKDKVANEVLRLEGKAAPESTGPSDLENDAMAAAEPSEEGSDGEEAGGLDAEGTEGSDDTEEELDDIFGDSGDEGVGRAKKESARVNTKKARIMEAKRALRKKIAETARKLQAIKEAKKENLLEHEGLYGAICQIKNDKTKNFAKELQEFVEKNIPRSVSSRSTLCYDVGTNIFGIIQRTMQGDEIDTRLDELENNLSYVEDKEVVKKVLRGVHKLVAMLETLTESKLSGKAKEEFLARMGKAPKKDAKPADKECKKGEKDCKEEVDEGKIPAGLKAYQDKKAGKKPAKPCKK